MGKDKMKNKVSYISIKQKTFIFTKPSSFRFLTELILCFF